MLRDPVDNSWLLFCLAPQLYLILLFPWSHSQLILQLTSPVNPSLTSLWGHLVLSLSLKWWSSPVSCPWLSSLLVPFLLCQVRSSGFYYYPDVDGAFQVVLVVKNLPANTGYIRDVGFILGLERSPGGGHGNRFQWIPWTEETGVQSMGSQRVWHDWSDLALTHML